MDWQCEEWSECTKDVEIRDCNFVKVAQHAQSTLCPEESEVPETRRSCEIPKNVSLSESSFKAETEESDKATSSITGAATTEVKEKSNFLIGIAIAIITVIVGILTYTLIFNHRNKK
jgi:t-SNARE complex subunit (syntaxin)